MTDRAKRNTAPRSRTTGGADEVRIIRGTSRGRSQIVAYLLLFVVACAVGYGVMLRPKASTPGFSVAQTAPLPAADSQQSGNPAAPVTSPAETRKPGSGSLFAERRGAQPRAAAPKEQGDTSLGLADFIPPGEQPTAAEVISELNRRGIYDGIGAFPPPGTSPPLVGLAVPDDFELPEGYVRHHQSTDDGQDIEPILMFSPDYEFFDENGNPVAIPDDRVVPAELAPPGLPLRDVEIPSDRERARPAH